MADNTPVTAAADFQALPLDFIIGAPLDAAIKAQRLSADGTVNFIKGMLNPAPAGGGASTPITVDFTASQQNTATGATVTTSVSAPLLSIVPVPHLRIDSLTINFKYEISQTTTQKSDVSGGASLDVTVGWGLIKGALHGSVSASKSNESTMSRNGSLEITVHASESPIPEGLAKILNFLTNSITAIPQTKPATQP
jgi:hypothetical protein